MEWTHRHTQTDTHIQIHTYRGESAQTSKEVVGPRKSRRSLRMVRENPIFIIALNSLQGGERTEEERWRQRERRGKKREWRKMINNGSGFKFLYRIAHG